MLVIHCKPLFSCLFHSFVYHLSIFLTSSFSRGKCPVILNHKSSHFRPIVSHFSPIPPPSPPPPFRSPLSTVSRSLPEPFSSASSMTQQCRVLLINPRAPFLLFSSRHFIPLRHPRRLTAAYLLDLPHLLRVREQDVAPEGLALFVLGGGSTGSR